MTIIPHSMKSPAQGGCGASDLKPCPFCGSGPAKGPSGYTQTSFSGVEVMGQFADPYVWCGTCCAQTRTCDSIPEAIAAWNERATPNGKAVAS